MVLVHIGDHIDDGQQAEKGAVGFVGLGDKVVAVAQMGVGSVDIEAAADDHCGVQPGGVEDGGGQRGGGGLAVGARNGYALAQAHEFGQHFGARDDGDVPAAAFHQFGIVVADGRGFDQHLHVAHVFGGMAHGHARAQLAQMPDHRRIAQIRAGNLVALIEQHLGNAAHARAADAHHVNVPDFAVHISNL